MADSQEFTLVGVTPEAQQGDLFTLVGVKPVSEVTALSKDDEQRFQTWAKNKKITDVDHPDSHYDYRGYWKEHAADSHEAGQHFPDTYKQHGHPTFSVESQYSTGPTDGGRWAGETYIPQGQTPPPPKPPQPRPFADIGAQAGALPPAEVAATLEHIDPVTGAAQLARGAAHLTAGTPMFPGAGAGAMPPTPPMLHPEQQPTRQEAMAASSDMLEGIFKVTSPLIAAGAITHPAITAAAVVKAVLAEKIGAKSAAYFGASKEGQRLTGDVAAFLSGSLSVHELTKRAVDTAATTTRAIVLAGKLSGEAVPGPVARPLAESTQPGYHAPTASIDTGIPSAVSVPVGSGPAETFTDIVRTALAPDGPEFQTHENLPAGTRRPITAEKEAAVAKADTSQAQLHAAAEALAEPEHQIVGVTAEQPPPVDAGGISLGGYAGPERRVVAGGAPDGTERRASNPADVAYENKLATEQARPADNSDVQPVAHEIVGVAPETEPQPQRLMGIDGLTKWYEATTDAGRQVVEVFRSAKDDGPAVVRVTDKDSGEQVSLTKADTFNAAVKYADKVMVADRAPETHDLAGTKFDHPTFRALATDEDRTLYAALHDIEGAMKRFDKLRASGATDPQLKEAIARSFGLQGGSGGHREIGVLDFDVKGGPDPSIAEPKFWSGADAKAGGASGKPTLQGKPLIDAVRRVMQIPAPDVFTEAPKRAKERTALAKTLSAPGEPVNLVHESGRTALAGPDMSKPGKFRVTRFEDGQPIGHVEYPTLAMAVDDALKEGYRPQALPAPADGRSVDTGAADGAVTSDVTRVVDGGEPAGAGLGSQPAGGAGSSGAEGVAGEQPAAPASVPEQPAKQARARKRRQAGSGERPAGGATVPGAGDVSGTSAGIDAAGHVDTADVADSQPVSDATARGEAPRWFSIDTAADLTDGGWTAKLDDNLAALKLLKQLDREGRPATDAEQAVLARYVGWGHTELASIVDIRPGYTPKDPRKLQARQALDSLLTASELKELSESTANAHYSFSDLPRAMWSLVERLGFTGGAILEPAVGSGHFLGTMPGAIRTARRTKVYGVDKEPIAAAIAKQLYQGAHIQASPLQEAVLPENYFDLIISNVPFGKIGVFDPAFVSPEKTPLTRNIHNYYFAKALDLARPGGLLVFVTSRYSLDSQGDTARQYLSKYAKFVGAFRLPDQAFRKTAGTDVVTDVIVLQKLGPGVTGKATEPKWMQAIERKDLGKAWDAEKNTETLVSTNEYYVNNPAHVLGTENRTGKMNRAANQYNVQGTVTPEQMAAIVARFPEKIYKASTAPPRKIASPNQKDAKQGAFVVEGGKLFIYDKATLEPSTLKGVALARAMAFVPLRDAYQGVIDAMIAQASDADLMKAQKALGQQYRAFVQAHGHVNLRENKRVLEADPNASRILALENIDVIKGEKGKPAQIVVTGLADIFTKRLMRPPAEPTTAGTPMDALLDSIAWKGHVDMAYMSSLTGKPEKELAQALAEEIFHDPSTKTWMARDEYLSGDVVTRLAQADAASKVDGNYAANVAALTGVQPTPITIDDFTGTPDVARSAPFGATWVPVPLITQFLNATGGSSVSVRLLNTKSKVEWYVEGWGRHEYLQAGYDYQAWVQEALNGDVPTIKTRKAPGDAPTIDPEATERYRQSLAQLKEQWATWWKSDPEAADQLVKIYNAMFNREVNRTFDGSRLVTPNSNPEIVLRAGQKDSVMGALQRGNTLLAQAVGWGKTFEMIAIAGEWKRKGFAHKPVIVVPNHIVEQWRRAFLAFYPAARVLLPEKADFKKENRKRLIARIANNDWDAVVLGASQFLKVGVRLDTLRAFVQEQEDQLLAEGAAELNITADEFSELVDAYGEDDKRAKQAIGGRGVPRSVKDVARAILNLRKRLQRRTDQQSKDPINFEDLGIDGLMVDEAHMFKNLYFYTSKTDIVGLKGSDTDQALDMYLKVRHINKTSNNRNVLFATGTPITNVMSEIYTVFRYLAQDQLDRLGMGGADSLLNAYATAVGEMEPRPEGGYKERTRLSQWTNLKELSRMFRRFADVVTTEDILKENARLEALGLPPLLKLPTAKKIVVELEPHPQAEEFLDQLRERIEELKTGRVDPKDDNHLKITTEASLAAIDLRLVLPGAVEDPNGRIPVAAKEITRRYKASTATKGTQIVFLDVGVPKGKNLPALPASIVGSQPGVTAEDAEGEPDEDAGELRDLEAEGEAELDAIRSLGNDKDLYGELKRLLIKEGIKPDEIAYIHQAQNASEQHRLFKAVQEGRVRVLLTTRAKGGTGMNVQDKIVALHHIDVPWRPDQMEQAEGRGIRQGNENESVDIVRYVTKRSFDEYRWYLLAKKQGFISSFYRGELTNMEDVDLTQVDMQVASAIASGDPRNLERIQVERQLTGLRARYENYARRRGQAERDKAAAESTIQRYEHLNAPLKVLEAEMAAWKAAPTITLSVVPGRLYGYNSGSVRAYDLKDTDSRKALKDDLARLMAVEHVNDEPIGTAGPFQIIRNTVERERRLEVTSKGTIQTLEGKHAGVLTIAVQVGQGHGSAQRIVGTTPDWDAANPPDLVRSLDRQLDAEWATDQRMNGDRIITDRKREIAALDKILEKQFDQSDEIKAKEDKLHELRVGLGIEKAVAAAGEQAPAAETTEAEAPGRPGFGDETGAVSLAPLVPIAEELKNLVDLLRMAFAPDTRTAESRTAAATLRAEIAGRDQRLAKVQHLIERIERRMDGWSKDQSKRFWDVMEGLAPPSSLSAEDRAVALAFRQILDYWTKQVTSRDLIRAYIQNYWGHEWVLNKTGLQQAIHAVFGRRPVQGPESFRKKRTIPTMREGIDVHGLEPVSWNPATQLMRKVAEMANSVKAYEMRKDLKKQGLIRFVGEGARKKAIAAGKIQPNWEVVPESFIGTVYGPPTFKTASGEEARIPFGRLVAGRYYAPPEVNLLIRNHLSPGLLGKSKAFDLLRNISALHTQALLGWSGFHLWLTGWESVTSKLTIALDAAQRGQFGTAAARALEVGPQGVVLDLIRGYKAVQEYYKTDPIGGQLVLGDVNLIIQGGGGVGWSRLEHMNAPHRFMTAVRGASAAAGRGEVLTAAKKAALAALLGPFAVIAAPTQAIMTHWVPYLKVAAYLDMARVELATLGPTATLSQQRQRLGEAWDATDNRFGLLRYENLFWNNRFKDALTSIVRAVGFTGGSLREFAGAPSAQIGRLVHNVNNPQDRRPWVDRKTLHFLSMVLVVMMGGALYMYTRTGKWPESLNDYLHPRNGKINPNTGDEDREDLISYMRTVHSWRRDPVRAALGTVQSFYQSLWETIANRDFSGTEVRNPDDPALTQFLQAAEHIVKGALPIPIQNAQRGMIGGETRTEQIAAAAWQAVAPTVPTSAAAQRTAAEEKLRQYQPPSQRTQEQARSLDLRRQIKKGTRAGTPEGAAAAQAAIDTGEVSKAQVKAALKAADYSALQAGVRQLPLAEALSVYEVASPAERAMLQPILLKPGTDGRNKVQRGILSAPPNARPRLQARIDAMFTLPVAGQP